MGKCVPMHFKNLDLDLGVDKIYNFVSDDVTNEGGETKSDSRIKLQNC